MIKAFNERTSINYNRKQMRNHWDARKKDWTLFKQLMRGETSLGRDDMRKTIIADDDVTTSFYYHNH